MTREYSCTLLMSEFVTHDVKRFIVSRPAGFEFEAGQGVELAIDTEHWRDEHRPFTPTSLANDQVLEFTIKCYPDHAGVTQALHLLQPGDRLRMSEPFGTIRYRGAGVFIAGGAGITPFIAILRDLAEKKQLSENTLIFSNKTPADIIFEKELLYYLGEHCILTLTKETHSGYLQRRIDHDFLRETITDFTQPFYVCGPPGFMKAVRGSLEDLGADPQALIFEK